MHSSNVMYNIPLIISMVQNAQVLMFLQVAYFMCGTRQGNISGFASSTSKNLSLILVEHNEADWY